MYSSIRDPRLVAVFEKFKKQVQQSEEECECEDARNLPEELKTLELDPVEDTKVDNYGTPYYIYKAIVIKAQSTDPNTNAFFGTKKQRSSKKKKV